MSIKFFEFDDGVDYEVEFDYRPGTPGNYWHPPEDGEVITENDVRIYVDGKPTDQVLSFDEFVERFAADRGIEKERADSLILAELQEAGELALADIDMGDEYDNDDRDNIWDFDDDGLYDHSIEEDTP